MSKKSKDYTTEDLINAISGSYGIMSTIALKLKCEWHTAEKYVKNNPEALRALIDEHERALDLAEYKILEHINMDDAQTARWFLGMKGKHRGYTSGNENQQEKNQLPPGEQQTVIIQIQYRNPHEQTNAASDGAQVLPLPSKSGTGK